MLTHERPNSGIHGLGVRGVHEQSLNPVVAERKVCTSHEPVEPAVDGLHQLTLMMRRERRGTVVQGVVRIRLPTFEPERGGDAGR
jgi:hypothetical protein